MLTWDNFEFVQSDEELPWFPFDAIVMEGETPDEMFSRVDKMYFRLLMYMTSQAVRMNIHYLPRTGEIKPVWEDACDVNSLPLCDYKIYSYGDLSFRAAEDVTILIKTKAENEDEGWVRHPHGYWYREVGDTIEFALFAMISSKTDQSKLGRV